MRVASPLRIPTLTAFTLLGSLSMGCSQAKRAPVPLDCSVLDHYELSPNAAFNSGNWFSSADSSVYANGAGTAAVSYTMLDETVCGVTQGIEFTSAGNHNWGSVAGNYVIGGFQAAMESDKNASAFTGLSFWARSSYARTFALILGDDTSTEIPGDGGKCVPQYLSTDGGIAARDDAGTLTADGSVPNPDFYGFGGVPVAEGCNNPFVAQLVTTDRWQFYALPFSAFTQVAQDPRVKPGGINKASIYSIAIRAPKDSTVDSWFANFAWYREKP